MSSDSDSDSVSSFRWLIYFDISIKQICRTTSILISLPFIVVLIYLFFSWLLGDILQFLMLLLIETSEISNDSVEDELIVVYEFVFNLENSEVTNISGSNRA